MSTLLGPLSTIFKPSASCLASNNLWNVYTTATISDSAFVLDYILLGPPPNSDCLPPSYSPTSVAYYSPGRCPSGYSVAQSAVGTYGGAVTETTHTCCPSGSDWIARPVGELELQFPFLSSFRCTSYFKADSTISVTVSNDSTTYPSTFSAVTGVGPNAFGVIVRFQEKDFASTTAAAEPTETFQSTSPSQTSHLPAPTSTSSSDNGGSGGLSTGAKAGIGTGVAAGVLAIALAVAIGFIIGRRNRERARREAASGASPGVEIRQGYAQGHPAVPYVRDERANSSPQWQSSDHRSELGLKSGGPRHELAVP